MKYNYTITCRFISELKSINHQGNKHEKIISRRRWPSKAKAIARTNKAAKEKMNQDWTNRLIIAYFLAIVELISIVVLNDVARDDSYYIVCSLFNFLIIFTLPYVSKVNLIVDFQYLNLAAFIVQGFGFFSYWYEIPVIFYNLCIHFISLSQIIRLLIIRKGDTDGYNENHYWRSMVHYCYFCYFKKMFKKESI